MGETNSNNFELSEQQWGYLLARLQKEETVLFLGPGVLPHPEHGTVENALNQFILEQSKASGDFVEKFYRDDKFFKLNDKDIDENLWYFMTNYRKFFEEKQEGLKEATELLNKLVKLPFSTIITLNPDDLLEKAYGKDLAHHTDFYNKKEKPNPYLPGSKDDPLIYYMRGNMSVDDSMVISHNDLFDYLESIYESKSMDNRFKAELKKAKYFIFLGLPLESWYMQLLLRLFDFHIVSPKILALKRFKEKDNGQKSVYEDLYKMDFHDHDGPEFIEQLYLQCESKNLLRAPSNSTVSASFERDAAYFQERLKNGHHEQSLEALEELSVKYLSPPSDYQSYFQALTVGAGNFRGSQRNYTIRLISKADFEVEEAKLIAFLHMQFQDLQEMINE